MKYLSGIYVLLFIVLFFVIETERQFIGSCILLGCGALMMTIISILEATNPTNIDDDDKDN